MPIYRRAALVVSVLACLTALPAAVSAAATAPPSIFGLSVNAGTISGGNPVAIYGDGFTGATSVLFGKTQAKITQTQDSEIDVTAPAHASGTVDIVVTTPGGKSAVTGDDVYAFSSRPRVYDTDTDTGSGTAGGPTTGGNTVYLSGAVFTGATSVKFGTTSATSLTVVSDSQITAVAPAHTAGTVDVTVANSGSTSYVSDSDQYTYSSAPGIDSLSVNVGPTLGGTAVQIFGHNLGGTTVVNFGAAQASIGSVSDTEVDVTSPPGAAGPVDVTLTAAGGTTAIEGNDVFTYSDKPYISSISPDAGPSTGGTPVQITGYNLGALTSVHFGSATATVASKSATAITVLSPAHALGAVDVTATSAKGTSPVTSADAFVYSDLPVVFDANRSGPVGGGNLVAIYGANLNGATAVHFGSSAANTVINVSASEVDAIVPAGSAGTVNVTVTTAAGTSDITANDIYTYTDTPVVYDLSTSQSPAAGGVSVDIYGDNFAGATSVRFGSTAATSVVVHDAQDITVTAPAHATGTVRVSVTTPKGTSSPSSYGNDLFTYGPAPVVSGLSPSSGPTPGGVAVDVQGVNLAGATAVYFGGTQVTPTNVSATDVQVVSPVLPAGVYDVTVVTPNGTSTPTGADLYTADDTPQVDDLSDSTGDPAGGDSVQIYGSNLGSTTSVQFGTAVATIVSVSSDEVDVTTPAHAAGTVDITVTTSHGTSAIQSADEFDYVATPTVFDVEPPVGSTGGGTTVTIEGDRLTAASAVTFGGVAAKSFTVVSDGEIRAVTPAHNSGIVHVQVTTANGTSGIDDDDDFTFSSLPVVDSLDTTSGPGAGGTMVAIEGHNLSKTTSVSFGSTPAASYTIVSSSEIDAVTPAHADGAVHVVVTNASGSSAIGGDVFTFNSKPIVYGVENSRGPTSGGQSVAVFGDNLTGATAVKFGTASATQLSVVSSTEVDVVTPALATTTVNVFVTTPKGTSAIAPGDQYTFTNAPVVTGVDPASGTVAAGTEVEIYGYGLSGATAVHFGSTSATGVTPVSPNEVDVVAPAHSAGTVHVTVTTPGGTSSINADDLYTYGSTGNVALARPSVSTGSTKGATLVRIYGRNLGSVTSAKFGTVAAARFIRISDHEIVLRTPPHAAGTVTVSLYRGTRKTALASTEFTYKRS